jgi:hypothetical protein
VQSAGHVSARSRKPSAKCARRAPVRDAVRADEDGNDPSTCNGLLSQPRIGRSGLKNTMGRLDCNLENFRDQRRIIRSQPSRTAADVKTTSPRSARFVTGRGERDQLNLAVRLTPRKFEALAFARMLRAAASAIPTCCRCAPLGKALRHSNASSPFALRTKNKCK